MDKRKGIFNAINCDIICICETHLAKENEIFVPGFSWFGHNRSEIHKNAPKASGGVWILIRNWIIECYNVCIIDKAYALGLKFTNQVTDSDFIMFACYLPPENSTRGRDAPSFFAHLLAQIYLYDECDAIFISGDFNARI